MILSRVLLLFCACFVAVSSTLAGDGLAREDGVRLLDVCQTALEWQNGTQTDADARAKASLCIGFVEGFVWGHGWKSWRTGDDMYFCPPEGFGFRDAIPVLVAYLEEHPERLIQRAHLLVFSALSSKFPCSQ